MTKFSELSVTDIMGATKQWSAYAKDVLGFDDDVSVDVTVKPLAGQVWVRGSDKFQSETDWSKKVGRGPPMTLIKRLMEAREGSEALDIEIWEALLQLGGRSSTMLDKSKFGDLGFTRSVDAALTLVPEGWHVVDMGMPNPAMKSKMAVAVVGLNERVGDDDEMLHGVHMDSLPIALCIAALRARAAVKEME